VKTCILHNGSKDVMNYIMGFCAFFAMGTMQEVDIDKVNGVCAHTLGDACN
jgi:hypothetical protein